MEDKERIEKALKLLEEQESERKVIRVEYASLFEDCRVITDAEAEEIHSRNVSNLDTKINNIEKQVAELHRVKFTPIQELVKKEELETRMETDILNYKPRKRKNKA